MQQTIRDRYQELIHESGKDRTLLNSRAFFGCGPDEISSAEAAGIKFYRGKVRDVFISKDTVRMVHTDRLTAFDKYIDVVPYKGIILQEMSQFWFRQLNGIVPHHYLSSPTSRELLAQLTTPVKVEVVVRGYLAGSMARAYERGERAFCGNQLPENLQAFAALPTPIITPTTKAEVFAHDENISVEEIIAQGICSVDEWNLISKYALKLYQLGSEILATKGWILADTKYEFGRNAAGDIILIDEIHTPDSSRFWIKDNYTDQLARLQAPTMLDKENVRRWLMAHGFSGEGQVPQVPVPVLAELGLVYLDVAELLLGRPLMAE